jgi:hypothetical protein
VIRDKNFTDADPAQLPEDTEYDHCNFLQRVPVTQGQSRRGVRLWPGDDTPRTFTNCNMVNCEPPPGSTLIECNTRIIEYDVYSHSDELVIDEVVVSSEDKHNMVLYARYDADTESYDDDPTPVTVPQDYRP